MDNDAPWRALETRGSDPPDAARQPGRAGLIAVVAVAAALVAGSIGLIAFAGMSHGGGVTVSTGSAGPETSAPPQRIVVQVAGAVLHPGVYTLAAGSRVADAIHAAGGYSADVDPRRAETQLNLAARLTDAQSVAVPRLGDASGTAAPGAEGGLVNLNAATAEQLDALPGIGPATAAKIIASRSSQPFTSVDDLVARKLVTTATLAKFRDQVTV